LMMAMMNFICGPCCAGLARSAEAQQQACHICVTGLTQRNQRVSSHLRKNACLFFGRLIND